MKILVNAELNFKRFEELDMIDLNTASKAKNKHLAYTNFMCFIKI